MSTKNSKVDAFIKSEKKWAEEIRILRDICLESSLEEDYKWSLPCYISGGKNIAIIQNFKNFCALMFFNGASLKDSKGLLKSPGENSQTSRRLEFTTTAEVSKAKSAIKSFIKEAIKVADNPKQIEKKPAKPATVPEEFKKELSKNKKLKTAFDNLTPGRQRLYLMHFSSAKQSETRTARVKKSIPKILKGLGLND